MMCILPPSSLDGCSVGHDHLAFLVIVDTVFVRSRFNSVDDMEWLIRHILVKPHLQCITSTSTR